MPRPLPGSILDINDERESLQSLMNSGDSMPLMTRAEAGKADLLFYWTGVPCLKGHKSKRYVKDARCVVCSRLTMDATSVLKNETRQVTKVNLNPAKRQKILEIYSKTGDLHQAAQSVGITIDQLNVHLAKSPSFTNAVSLLERRLNKTKEQEVEIYRPTKMVWDEAKRTLFIRAYVDTGDMVLARQAVGASPSNYFDELEVNPEFADAVKAAEPKAMKALEEVAINMAKAGNDKLLTLVLKAKMKSEYGDKIQIDQTVNTFIKVSDDTLNTRIQGLVNKYGQFGQQQTAGRVIDGEFESRPIEIESKGKRIPVGLLGRTGSSQDSQ